MIFFCMYVASENLDFDYGVHANSEAEAEALAEAYHHDSIVLYVENYDLMMKKEYNGYYDNQPEEAREVVARYEELGGEPPF